MILGSLDTPNICSERWYSRLIACVTFENHRYHPLMVVLATRDGKTLRSVARWESILCTVVPRDKGEKKLLACEADATPATYHATYIHTI